VVLLLLLPTTTAMRDDVEIERSRRLFIADADAHRHDLMMITIVHGIAVAEERCMGIHDMPTHAQATLIRGVLDSRTDREIVG